MSPLLQYIIVFAAVLACVAFVGWQAYQSLAGHKSKIGSCCSKGCGHDSPSPQKAGGQGAAPSGQRIAFLPVEMLERRKPRR
jgi:hypothetical protein